jgi:hypothetical protein
VLIHPHDHLERGEIPGDLLPNCRLLDLHCDPLAIMRLRSVDLGYTGTGSSLVLKDSKHAVGAVWRAVELLFKDLENSLVGDLGCIVEELGESALKSTGKKRSIGSDGWA